jgi:uncharacterized peroxidase-related enzyme
MADSAPTMSFISSPGSSPSVDSVHQESLDADGYVPNFVRVWCWRPDILEQFGKLRSDLIADSTLTEREVAVLTVATVSSLGDSYCSLAWGATLAVRIDAQTAGGVIRADDSGLSEREAALAAWARKLVDDPNDTTEADVRRLREAGLSEREIFEATVWIGFRLGFSTINDALGLQPDAELYERVPGTVRDAVSFGRPSVGG